MWRTPENSILLRCPTGLGNRLNVIQSGVLLGRAINKRVYFEWVQNHEVGCDYEDLFKPPKEFSIHKKMPITPYIKTDWLREINTDTKIAALNGILKNYKRGIRKLKDVMHWIYFGFSGYEQIRDGVATQTLCERALMGKKRILVCSNDRFYPLDRSLNVGLYTHVEPTAELQNRIDAVAKQFTDKTVGVQIRRGGDCTPRSAKDTNMPDKYVPDKVFIRIMEDEVAEDKDRNFYLATNSHATRETFKNHFGERVMLQPKPDYSRGGDGMKCAVVDLFSLSKTTRIIRGHTSYAGIAGQIGGIASTQFNRNGTICHRNDAIL